MIKITKYKQLYDVDNKEQGIIISGTCLSTDKKPLEYAGGSILIETDHDEGFWIWMFDEASMSWILQTTWGTEGSSKKCDCPPVKEIIAQTLAKLPIASRTKLGIVQIVDECLIIKDGVLSIDYDKLAEKLGLSLSDELIEQIKNEVYQSMKDYIDNTVKNEIMQRVKETIEENMQTIIQQVLDNLPVASKTQKGIMQIGTGLADGGNGVVNLDETYTNNFISKYVSNNYDGWKKDISEYTINNIPKADTNTYGLVKIGDNITVNNGVIDYELPLMTVSVRGGAKLRDGTTEGDVQLSATEGMYVDLTAIDNKIAALEKQAGITTTTTE